MIHADAVLADEAIVMAAYEALAKRHRFSRTRGRRGFSAPTIAPNRKLMSIEILAFDVAANQDASDLGFNHLKHCKTVAKASGW
jgi:hypothetical protein